MLELTTRCNFSCFHCSRTYFHCEKTDIDRKLLDRLLTDVFPKCGWLTVTGFGEQTISPLYSHLMSRLVDLGVTIHFSTNTSTLNVPHIDSLVLHDANVILSVDGTSRKTFETIRHGGSWESLLSTLFMIKRIRSIRESGSLFRVTFVIMRMNIHELPDMIRLIHFFKLDDLTVQDYLPFNESSVDLQSLRNEPQRANQFLDSASNLANSLGIKILMPSHFSEESFSSNDNLWTKILKTRRVFSSRKRFPMRCFQPWQHPNIKANGNVVPCCNSMRSMGNLETKSFSEIWNGWRFRLFRLMVDSGLPPPECRNCNVIDGINAGNPGNILSQEGFIIKAFYFLERKFLSKLLRRFV